MKFSGHIKNLLLISLSLPLIGEGQTNPYGEVSIASPTAASLGKYADIPVSYHTGIPQINIPLYTVKAGPLSLPISLNYHASGIKVLETASWVGTGWSLDAGGVITRTVVGQPDEKNTGSGAVDLYGYYSDSGYNKYINKNFPYEDWVGMSAGRLDGEPDLFFFNFGGYSGKFYFRDDHTAILVPQQDIKIIPYFPNPGYQSIQGFTVITPDGTKYYFGSTPAYPDTPNSPPPVELTNPYSSETGYQSGTALSSWYLNKITSADGQFSITLTYSSEVYGFYTLSCPPRDTNTSPSTPELNLIKNIISGVRLNQIKFPNGTVTFNPGAYRTDLSDNYPNNLDNSNSSARTLGSINITNNGFSNGFCKKFLFNYSYFIDNTSIQPTVLTTAGLNMQTDKSRLRLDSVLEMSCDNLLRIPARKFTYFNDLLPRRINVAIDHWGFYNGAISNQTLIPSYFTNDGVTTTQIPGANRNSAWPAMRGGALQKITYPTGGVTTFDFQAEDSFTNSNSDLESVNIGSSNVHLYGQDTKYTETITILSNGNPITATVFNNTRDFQASIVFKDSTGTPVYSNSSLGDNNYPTGQTLIVNPISLRAGTYSATLTIPNGPASGEGASVIYSQLAYVVHSYNVTIGGLRIKTINSTSSPTDPNPIITNYSYPNGAYIYSSPTYIQHVRNDVVNTLGFWDVVNGFWKNITNAAGCPLSGGFYKKGGGSLRPMGTSQGFHVGFPVVKVSQTGNGYSMYNYYTSNTGFAPQTFNPNPPIIDVELLACEGSAPNYPAAPNPFDARKGELYYEQHYNQGGQLLKDAYYYPEFDTTSQQPTPGFLVATLSNGGILGTYYNLVSPRRTKMHKIETEYVPGIGGVQQDTYTYYGSPYHTQETRRVTTTSTGDSLITNTKYSPDFHLSSWDILPSCDTTYATVCRACLTQYNKAYQACSGQPSVCITDSFLVYRRCVSDARTTYVNCQFTNYTGVPGNNYKSQHDATKSAAGTELKPILDLQDSNRVVPIEITDFRDGSLLRSNFTRYDYFSYPPNIPFPNKTQLISISTPSQTFTGSVISGSTLAKDSRYTDESTYTFLNGSPSRVVSHDGMVTIYIWDYLNTNPIAKTIAPSIDSTAFTSFEADGMGNWNIPSTIRDTINFITGIKSYNLINGSITKTGLTTGKKYTISYWSKNGIYSISGATTSSKTGRVSNGWTYYEHAITMTGSTLTISGTGNIDELRMYPQGAQMSSYTYKPIVGITTMNDPNSEITYYEYDGLERLKNIKDYLGNIIKNYQYNYVDPNSCGTNCEIVNMQTFAGTNTLSYPVGVFNLYGKLLGNATTQAQYVTIWMSDTADSHTGTIVAGIDSMHFQFTVNGGRTIPNGLTGCRYYQYNLTYNQINGITNFNGCYVDFGDGAKMRLGNSPLDTTGLILPANTITYFDNLNVYPFPNGRYPFFIHNYSDTSLKIITIYHNDQTEQPSIFCSYAYTQNCLSHISGIRGVFPQNMQSLFANNIWSFTNVSSIVNWYSINSILYLSIPNLNSFPQDFMSNNKGLQLIVMGSGKLSILKSNWNLFFTNITTLVLDNASWNQEDLSSLNQLSYFELSDDVAAHLTSSILDNIFNQLAAGGGKFIKGGFCAFDTGNYATLKNTSASYTSVTFLRSQNWNFRIGEGVQPLP